MTKKISNYAEYRILQLCDGSRTVDDIVNIVFAETNIAPQLIREAVHKSHADLLPHGYFKPHKGNLCCVHGAAERFLVEYGFPSPVVVNWEITSACNLRCPHCYARAGAKKPEELSLDEQKKVVKQISELRPAVIDVSGGEPLLHPHFEELATHATTMLRPLGTKVKLLTNGVLIDDAMARFVAATFDFVHISIDGIGETHDRFRKSAGSYQAAVNAIVCLRNANTPVCMTVTIHKNSVNEIQAICNLAKELNVNRLRFGFFSSAGRGVENAQAETLTPQKRRKVYQSIVEYRDHLPGIPIDSRERFYGMDSTECSSETFGCGSLFCRAGTRIMFISSQGYVTPCYMLNEPRHYAGSIRNAHLIDIWRESSVMQEWRNLKISAIEGCRSCDRRGSCGGGMRCCAYGDSGRIDGKDPLCIYADEVNPCLEEGVVTCQS
jgi:radical SAM protein with 4Fe4S-binding SPASM domain